MATHTGLQRMVALGCTPAALRAAVGPAATSCSRRSAAQNDDGRAQSRRERGTCPHVEQSLPRSTHLRPRINPVARYDSNLPTFAHGGVVRVLGPAYAASPDAQLDVVQVYMWLQHTQPTAPAHPGQPRAWRRSTPRRAEAGGAVYGWECKACTLPPGFVLLGRLPPTYATGNSASSE